MSHLSIASLQLSLTDGDNLSVISNAIADTKSRFPWVEMIVIGELASFGISKSFTEKLPGKTEEFYCQIAKKHQVWLIPGSLFEDKDGKVYNTSPIINDKGEVVERYQKIFPFYPYEANVECGNKFVVIDHPKARIGVAICYDLWFPEVARALVSLGAEVIIYPTLTGTIDRATELILSQATAIQNQCYVLSVNSSGALANGRSIVVGPEGDIIYQAGENQEIIPVELDLNRVQRTRERGIFGLGQPLKSFRDNSIDYPQYNNKNNALESLGELKKP